MIHGRKVLKPPCMGGDMDEFDDGFGTLVDVLGHDNFRPRPLAHLNSVSRRS